MTPCQKLLKKDPMTGGDFERWARAEYPRLERLAAKIEVSVTTLYNWFKNPNLDRPIVLRLADAGCPKAIEETRQSHRKAVGET